MKVSASLVASIRLWVLAVLILLSSSALAQRDHVVRSGQTLSRIARIYHVEVADLAAANRLPRSAALRPGQVLLVPDPGEIFVRAGDSLSEVAARYNISVAELRRANRLRGSAVRAGQRLRLPGAARADVVETRDWGPPANPGTIAFQRGRESVRVQMLDADGNVLPDGLTALGRMLDPGTARGEEVADVRVPNPRLGLLLTRISDHFGGRPITIVSGYREAGGFTRESSRHTQGRAADIRIAGVGNRSLWEFCRSIHHVGCGYYPRSTFVHVDARLTRAQWVDWSGPGRRPRYGTLRGPVRGNRSRRFPFARATSDLPLDIVVASAPPRPFHDDVTVDALEAEDTDLDAAETPELPTASAFVRALGRVRVRALP